MYVWVSPLLLLTNTLVLFAYLCHFAIIRVIRAHPLTHLLPVLLACLLRFLACRSEALNAQRACLKADLYKSLCQKKRLSGLGWRRQG